MPSKFWEYRPPRNQRLAPELYSQAGRSCFVTVRTARDTTPFTRASYAEIAVRCLLEQRAKSGCQVDVYCVMPDHVHLVVTPIHDGASSLTYVDRFKGWCSFVMRRAGWTGSTTLTPPGPGGTPSP